MNIKADETEACFGGEATDVTQHPDIDQSKRNTRKPFTGRGTTF